MVLSALYAKTPRWGNWVWKELAQRSDSFNAECFVEWLTLNFKSIVLAPVNANYIKESVLVTLDE